MRPTKLKVQGLTAFRKPVEVDFTDLDLFAITGPTGAGKSSLVDAITYALFGQAPRIGRSIRELISQGEDRLKVSLEFTVHGDSYRIFRESSRKSQRPPQLERFDKKTGEWRSEEVDRVRDTNAFIERLLHMDYEAFIRSVLLPQGEFQEFLAGDRDQRRRVLDGLLRLGVYGDMQRAANAIATRQNENATRIADRLASELANATPAALKEAKRELADRKSEAKEATSAREVLEAARLIAETLASAREQERTTTAALSAAEKRLREAKDATQTGAAKAEAVRKKVAALAEQLEANTFDADEYQRYRDSARLANDLAKEEKSLAELDGERDTLDSQVTAATTDVEKAASAHEKAEKATKEADEGLDAARRTNAAAALQQRLKAGDPCPVCGQSVGELPHIEHPALRDAQAAAKRAKDAADAARKAAKTAQDTLTQLQARVEAKAESRDAAAKRVEERRAGLKETLGREPPPAKEIAAQLAQLKKAEAERTQLTAEIETRNKALAEITAGMAAATADLGHLQGELDAADRDAKTAAEKASGAEAKLREAATCSGWDDILRALDEAKDAAPVLGRRLDEARDREGDVREAIGAGQTRIETIEANIEKAKGLRAEEKTAREEASLARDLASLLQTNAFPTFIRESALQTLARDGSKRLLEISGGRYNFVVEGQDFSIEDRWNGSEKRSVKTLSGGETFLASLALALALAEQLPGLAGEEAGGSLESLFIDEGFSHLDSETLDDVATALEALGQDRSRLIGVITHVPALAERMPARIVVHKTQAGSSVSVE
ncbi:MAG: SMC family ATPase [Chloroflexi bacterium]|nr:SMC family ATPase [Chloroflexota bacterium]